jgi:hypothetical protein
MIFCVLLQHPFGELSHAVFQRNRWLVAEDSAGAGDVREAVANIASPVLSADLRLDVRAEVRLRIAATSSTV